MIDNFYDAETFVFDEEVLNLSDFFKGSSHSRTDSEFKNVLTSINHFID